MKWIAVYLFNSYIEIGYKLARKRRVGVELLKKIKYIASNISLSEAVCPDILNCHWCIIRFYNRIDTETQPVHSYFPSW